jgi:Predicted nucleic acid-binding protein, contains PIN domain
LILVDTNVLVDILEDDPKWAEWSLSQMYDQSKIHRPVINPIIYAELSLTFSTHEALDEEIGEMRLEIINIPRPALFLAGKAFAQYRRRGGQKHNVLADFFICAHAAVSGFPILTRDSRRYRSYFPALKIISPDP